MAKRNQFDKNHPKYYTGEIMITLTMRDLKRKFRTKTEAENYEVRIKNRIGG